MLTQELLKTIFYLKDETLHWKISPSNNVKIGDIAGCVDKNTGYRKVSINGKFYYAHRLRYFFEVGHWPKDQIDHKNSLDNSWDNLREATNSQNGANKEKGKNNTSGYKGVSWNKYHNKWRSRIMKDEKDYHLGYFDCPIEAAKIYDRKAIELFRDYARTNF